MLESSTTDTQMPETDDFSAYVRLDGQEQDSDDLKDGEVNFLTPSDWTDIILEVQNSRLHFSKSYLAAWSPVFRNMFYGDFKEKLQHEVPLPNKTVEEIQELLRCICPVPRIKPVTDANVFLLLKLADEYEMQDLLCRCSDVLKTVISRSQSQKPTEANKLNPLEALRIACDIGLADLTNFFLPFCAAESTAAIEKYHSLLPVNIIAALYHAKLKLLTDQVSSTGAVSFALVSYTSGSYTCSFCGKSANNGAHRKCLVCARTICAQTDCGRQHLCATAKAVHCSQCKAHTLLGLTTERCKCFKVQFSPALLNLKKLRLANVAGK